MEILGVGPLEFLFIIVLMLLVLGPQGMIKALHDVGDFLRKVVQSPVWKTIVNSSQELRNVQTQIMKDSGLDESIKDIRESTQSLNEVTNNLTKPIIEGSKIEPIKFTIPKEVPPPKEKKAVSAPALKAVETETPAAQNIETAQTPSEPVAKENINLAEATTVAVSEPEIEIILPEKKNEKKG